MLWNGFMNVGHLLGVMKTLKKTFRIIYELSAMGPSELGTIADRTDLPRSTVHHHLSALEENGFAVNTGGIYHLSMKFLDVGEQVRRRKELFEIARSEIDELADRIDRPVTLFILEHGSAVVLYTRNEDPAIPITLYPGQHFPLHATAAGKALLSDQENPFSGNHFQTGGLSSFTEQTITDQDMLTKTLREATNQGYTISREERWNGRCSIAVPFSPKGDTPYAAIETALTPEQFQEINRSELVIELQQTANVIDIKSDYSL